MADLTAVRTGLANRLATIPNMRAYHAVPDKPELPAAIVVLQDADYRQVMGPGVAWRFHAQLLVSRWDAIRAQDHLDPYVSDTGASSVPAAVTADIKLGGVATSSLVMRLTHYGKYESNGVAYAGCAFEIEVITTS